MPRTSIADYLADFRRLGRELAYAERVGYRIRRHTYADVAALAFRFARELKGRGIRKGDRIMLWGPNSAAWVAAFFACANRGVVAVPMDHAASSDFAARVFHQVGAKLVLSSHDHDLPGSPTLFFEAFETALQSHSPMPLEPEQSRSSDPLQIVFTSGTTADPKGICGTRSESKERLERGTNGSTKDCPCLSIHVLLWPSCIRIGERSQQLRAPANTRFSTANS